MNQPSDFDHAIWAERAAEQDDRPLFVIAYTIAALGGAIIGFAFGLGIGAGWLA